MARIRRIETEPNLSLEVNLFCNLKDVLQRNARCQLLVGIIKDRPISSLRESHARIINAKISVCLAINYHLSEPIQIVLSRWVANQTCFIVENRHHCCVVHFRVWLLEHCEFSFEALYLEADIVLGVFRRLDWSLEDLFNGFNEIRSNELLGNCCCAIHCHAFSRNFATIQVGMIVW